MIRLVKRSLKVSLLALAVLATDAYSGELIRNATVVEVASNYSGGAEFTIKLSGGNGLCENAPWIIFPEAEAGSTTSHKHAIAISLLAFSTGQKVRIHSFDSDSCFKADFIAISK